jgi:hypothetical protein
MYPKNKKIKDGAYQVSTHTSTNQISEIGCGNQKPYFCEICVPHTIPLP